MPMEAAQTACHFHLSCPALPPARCSPCSIHLVTIGLDGFYQNAPGVYQNPFTSASDYGTDWVATTSAPSIDFGMFNIYPDIYNVRARRSCAGGSVDGEACK